MVWWTLLQKLLPPIVVWAIVRLPPVRQAKEKRFRKNLEQELAEFRDKRPTGDRDVHLRHMVVCNATARYSQEEWQTETPQITFPKWEQEDTCIACKWCRDLMVTHRGDTLCPNGCGLPVRYYEIRVA